MKSIVVVCFFIALNGVCSNEIKLITTGVEKTIDSIDVEIYLPFRNIPFVRVGYLIDEYPGFYNETQIKTKTQNITFRISDLNPGSTVRVNVSTFKFSPKLEGEIVFKTDLDVAKDVTVYNITDNTAYFDFTKPTGFYDKLKITCFYDDSYFGQIVSNDASSGVCEKIKTGSHFKISIETLKDGFETKEIENDAIFPSVDCDSIEYNQETNTFTWSGELNNKVDGYRLHLFEADSNDLIQSIVVNPPDTIYKFAHLLHNKQYLLKLETYIWGSFAQKTCKYQFQTKGCPELKFNINKPLKIYDISDIESASVTFSDKTFSPLLDIDNLIVIIGSSTKCNHLSALPKDFNENCFISHNFTGTIGLAYENHTNSFIAELIQPENCLPTKKLCLSKLKKRTDYYVTVRAVIRNCDYKDSNTLLVRIEEPFPIGIAVGSTLGAVALIVLIAMLIVFLRSNCRKASKDITRPNKNFRKQTPKNTTEELQKLQHDV